MAIQPLSDTCDEVARFGKLFIDVRHALALQRALDDLPVLRNEPDARSAVCVRLYPIDPWHVRNQQPMRVENYSPSIIQLVNLDVKREQAARVGVQCGRLPQTSRVPDFAKRH